MTYSLRLQPRLERLFIVRFILSAIQLPRTLGTRRTTYAVVAIGIIKLYLQFLPTE